MQFGQRLRYVQGARARPCSWERPKKPLQPTSGGGGHGRVIVGFAARSERGNGSDPQNAEIEAVIDVPENVTFGFCRARRPPVNY
jgi:hypothetical protein